MNPPEKTYSVYVPQFLSNIIAQNLEPTKLRSTLSDQNWLCSDLIKELHSHYPQASSIKNATRERDKDSFSNSCNKLFPVGRIFASDIQLKQYLTNFASAWSFVISRHGKAMVCHYSPPRKRNQTANSEIIHPSVTDHQQSLKKRKSDRETISCPFSIRFNYVGVPRANRGILILYQVKITSVNSTHTCTLEPMVQRRAVQASGKLSSIDLNSMKGVIDLLRNKPHTAASTLRPMLENVLPRHCGLTSMFISNFRRRVMNYLIKTDNYEDLTMDTATMLVSKDVNAADEFVQNLDDPIVMQNFTAILRSTMRENKTTWKALNMLDEVKSKLRGFDYRIWKDSDGFPKGILYDCKYAKKCHSFWLCVIYGYAIETIQFTWLAILWCINER